MGEVYPLGAGMATPPVPWGTGVLVRSAVASRPHAERSLLGAAVATVLGGSRGLCRLGNGTVVGLPLAPIGALEVHGQWSVVGLAGGLADEPHRRLGVHGRRPVLLDLRHAFLVDVLLPHGLPGLVRHDNGAVHDQCVLLVLRVGVLQDDTGAKRGLVGSVANAVDKLLGFIRGRHVEAQCLPVLVRLDDVGHERVGGRVTATGGGDGGHGCRLRVERVQVERHSDPPGSLSVRFYRTMNSSTDTTVLACRSLVRPHTYSGMRHHGSVEGTSTMSVGGMRVPSGSAHHSSTVNAALRV